MTKIEIFAVANGPASDASTPVRLKAKGPATSKHRHPRSVRLVFAVGGVTASGATMESSAGVRVMEVNWVGVTAQGGMGSVGGETGYGEGGLGGGVG